MYVIYVHKGTSSPKRKKCKRDKKDRRSKGEKVMEKAMESFMNHQTEAEQRFRKWEEERWQKEIELDEKRRQEDREHELRLFRMLGQMVNPRETTYPSPSYTYDYEY